jgi:DNA-binding MarR family transcriptional regulator
MMTKHRLLGYLAGVPDAPAAEVAAVFRVTLPAAGMTLLRLCRSGLAARSRDPHDGHFFYSITDKGRKRLLFLHEDL